MTEFVAHSEKDLSKAVELLLNRLGGSKKILLTGELGAGKTTFTQAFCRRLKVREAVTSPTFALVNEYSYKDHENRERLVHHLDLYRLKSLEEALEIGIEEYLYDDDYCLIEWPEIIEALLPEDIVQVKIETLADTSRKIIIL